MSPFFADGLPGWIENILNQSPVVAVFLGMPALLFFYIKKQHKENLKTKDAEIKRLSEEKKELQTRLFGAPLLSTEDSSLQKPKDTEPAKGKGKAKETTTKKDKKGGRR